MVKHFLMAEPFAEFYRLDGTRGSFIDWKSFTVKRFEGPVNITVVSDGHGGELRYRTDDPMVHVVAIESSKGD